MNTAITLHTRTRPARTARQLVALCAATLAALPATAQITTVPTTNTNLLRSVLNAQGLSIDSVSIHNGVAGQFGTFSSFDLRPVTLRPGVVLSSGDVTNLTPIPGATDQSYEPSSPPSQVNTQMNEEPITGGTPEFNAYGLTEGNIENFSGGFDVAALRVDFTLDNDSPVKFDFIFGSVEFPYWTGQFTDSFLVFLDGTAPENQITIDAAGNAVQVGSSFAGLETTGDLNTAFSDPHGLIHHLTTTTAKLDAGEHFLIFEVGDVNDHILDSAAFISNLRAEDGIEGTEPTDDGPDDGCPDITTQPRSASTCAFGAAAFSVAAQGDGQLKYQWQWQQVGGGQPWLDLDEGVNTDSEDVDRFVAVGTKSHQLAINSDDQPLGTLSVVRSLRCVVSNNCGDRPSDRANLVICAADFNCDEFVDFTDFDAFVTAFESGGPGGDFNADGFLDFTDFDEFVAAFEQGC